MFTFKLAWKNMWRNQHRTLIVMASLSFAVLLSILTSCLKAGIFDNLVRNLVGYYSGYIQIHKQGYWDERILENSFQSSFSLEQRILADKRIRALAPRLESFALASSGDKTKGCLVVGVDPQRENLITALQEKIIQGRYLMQDDHSVMLSEGLMKRLGVRVEDTIVLIGQGYHGYTAAGKYNISAVLRFGSPELNENALFLSIGAAQQLYAAPQMLTAYVLAIDKSNDLMAINHDLKSQLDETYEAMTWEEMMPDIKQHIQGDSSNMQIVQMILYLLVSFGIFSTLLVMIAERKYEMGMLIAIGMKKIHLARVLLIESILTFLCGCLIGIVISVPIVVYLNRHPIRMSGDLAKAYERFGFEAIFPTSTNYWYFIEQAVIVLSIGFILSLYLVYKTISLNPVQAMRK